MQTVAIVGVGLIGASFGLALRKAGFAGPIIGVSSPDAIAEGLKVGAISASGTLKEAADKADLIYLAQPVDRILDTLGWLGPMARKETIITDAGSTKSAIVQQAKAFLQFAPFIGGHPMAGKEARGALAADADLFRNRTYVLTPEGIRVPEEFKEILRSIGAVIREMSAEEHDQTVAFTSHLPQLLSTALAALLAKQKLPEIQHVFGSGLLDMTRLALSAPELWASILKTNKENISKVIQSYTDLLLELKASIEADDLDAVFTTAAEFSSTLRKPAN